MRKCTVMFAGGGTGGHLTPGLAVAEEFGRRDSSVNCVFVGSDRPLEKRIVEAAGFEHIALPVQSPGVAIRRPLRSVVQAYRGLHGMRRAMRELQPDIAIGLGGFASVLPIWYSRRHRLPTILLEQNIVAGRATRMLAAKAYAVCTSFPETDFGQARSKRVIVTGNPVRSKITAFHPSPSDIDRRTLLVLGGSQGATAVNDCVLSMLPHLKSFLKTWDIIHQTGVHDENRVRNRYKDLGFPATVAAFFPDLSQHYADADLAITRAGATTLSELACAGVPSILVPYPTAKDDHQRRNAHFFTNADAAIVCEQDADPNEWCELTQRMLCESAKRAKMRRAMTALAKPQAARDVADVVMELLSDT